MASRGGTDSLETYRKKRRFGETPEPEGGTGSKGGNLYAIQKHDATRLHYDLRLELDGVLKSWAITKGPSLDPSEKRLAVRTEDHPMDYGDFEGVIPEGNYGAGTVLLWDQGTWEPIKDPRKGLKEGKLEFRIEGKRLKGRWALVRMKPRKGEKRENWLLIKGDDGKAERGEEGEITEQRSRSVASRRAMKSIAEDPDATWGKRDGKKADDGNKRGKPPGYVKPALATLVDEIPSGDDWIFEIKFDGYRALAAVDGEAVTIYTRNGLDWTDRFGKVAEALAGLGLEGALIDGEMVVVDGKGRSDFSSLQRALKGEGGTISFFAFDLMALEGKSQRSRPLLDRKEALRKALGKAGRKGPVYYTDHVDDGRRMFEELCGKGFEGVIAKRSDSQYRSGRGRSWLKIKCGAEQEFVVVGWSPSSRDRPFSSLLLAVHEKGELRYAGRVGTGFSQDELKELHGRMKRIERKTPAVEGDIPASVRRHAHWVRPELVAQVGFEEFTADGLVRHGRYLGLRQDKAAKDVVRERPSGKGEG
jgi:bifunctional non-homologous end joining protein LigD